MRIFIYLCNVFRKRLTFYCSTFPERTTTSEKITSKTNSHWSVHYKCRLHRREFEAVVGLFRVMDGLRFLCIPELVPQDETTNTKKNYNNT